MRDSEHECGSASFSLTEDSRKMAEVAMASNYDMVAPGCLNAWLGLSDSEWKT